MNEICWNILAAIWGWWWWKIFVLQLLFCKINSVFSRTWAHFEDSEIEHKAFKLAARQPAVDRYQELNNGFGFCGGGKRQRKDHTQWYWEPVGVFTELQHTTTGKKKEMSALKGSLYVKQLLPNANWNSLIFCSELSHEHFLSFDLIF